MTSFSVGQRVVISEKGLGTIAFIGNTEFADGEWIGVVLDEPKGKNNGTVQKKDGKSVSYFSCNDNHGLYVRAKQIESVVNDQSDLTRSASNQSVKSQGSNSGKIPAPSTSSNSTKSSNIPSNNAGIRPPSTANTANRTQAPSGLPRSGQSSNEEISTSKKDIKPSTATSTQPKPTNEQVKKIENVPVESTSSIIDSAESQQLISSLKSQIADKDEQIQTLIKKRRDDLEKLKDSERTKIELDKLQSYKREAQERIKELNDKLQKTENEFQTLKQEYQNYRDEMSDTEMRLESLTLDVQINEEKVEVLTSENTELKKYLEEVQLELDVLKSEIQLNGSEEVGKHFQEKYNDERIKKLEQALIQLRDLSLSKQAENDTLTKQCEIYEKKVNSLTKENETAKANLTTMQANISDLKEQVDTYLGVQEMVDVLTTGKLSLEDQVRELQTIVDNLESLHDVDREVEEHAKEVERDLRQKIDLLESQIRQKEKEIEQHQYMIGDHERTILKYRDVLKNVQFENEQMKRDIEKYNEQLKLVGTVQSTEFKTKILETKAYGERIDNELRKLDAQNLSRHLQLLTLLLPEQFMKRGGDYDCILIWLLIQRLISKCDLITNEIQKQIERIEQINVEDVIKSHRAEKWSSICKISQTLSIFRMILRKYFKAIETCQPDVLRHLANAYHDLLTHEKNLDFLIDLLQKDQLHDTISFDALDKTIAFYENIYKSYLSQEKYSMSNYMRDLVRIVSLSSDVLQADIQRVQILQKKETEKSPFANLIERLSESNEQMRNQAAKIHRLVPQDIDSNRLLLLDNETIVSVENAIKNLERLAKTFHEICAGLATQIVILPDANARVSTQEIESIAYQACDKIYKNEDNGPYESLWNSMHETVTILAKIGNSLENGTYESDSIEQNEKSKQTVYIIVEHLKNLINQSESIRARMELKDAELFDVKKMLKLKQDEHSELTIRLSLNEKRVDTVQKEFDEMNNRHKQILEEARVDAQKQIKQREDTIAVLQNDIEQLEQEIKKLKESLKQTTRTKLVDDLKQKKLGSGVNSESTNDINSLSRQNLSSPINEEEVLTLRNTIRLLKDELWQLKMARTSTELSHISKPLKETKSNEIADIYKNSTLLLNDLFSTIANYKITGENVQAKQEIVRSKMKLIDQKTFDLNNRLNQCQIQYIPGSTVQSSMKTFLHPQFSQSLTKDRQLAAEIQLPGTHNTGGDFDITQEQFRTIMQEAIGCI